MTLQLKHHHRKRLLYNRRHYWGGHGGSKRLNTPKPCSCFMCGNPRKMFKKRTLQELRSIDKMKEHEL